MHLTLKPILQKSKRMFRPRTLLTIFLCLGYAVVFAQSEAPERNAAAQEIQGDWQLLPLPETLQLKALKTNPWPAECQWYSYGATGVLKSIDKLRGPCETLSPAQLEEALVHVPPVVSWKYDLSPVYKKGVVLVTRSDVKGYSELWEPHVVVRTFSKDGAEFREGDLILYLADLKAHQLVWIRHLRKLGQ